MSSKIISTKKRGVYMAHICSGCGFPVISVVQVEAQGQQSYSFSEQKATQQAEEAAETGIYDARHRIEACYKTKSVLVGYKKESRSISAGCSCSSSFRGVDCPCPKCLNLEPWQSNSSKYKMEDLAKENFPTVFAYQIAAEQWASDELKKMSKTISNNQENEDLVNKATERITESCVSLDNYYKQLDSFAEIAERDRITNEISDIKAKKSQIGVFDFKNKKIVKETLKDLNNQLAYINSIINLKITPIKISIEKLKKEMFIPQAIAFGFSEKQLSKSLGNSTTYYYLANDIPNEFISKIKCTEKERESEMPDDLQSDNETLNEMDSPVFCKKCGYKLLSDSTFCSKCGTKVV